MTDIDDTLAKVDRLNSEATPRDAVCTCGADNDHHPFGCPRNAEWHRVTEAKKERDAYYRTACPSLSVEVRRLLGEVERLQAEHDHVKAKAARWGDAVTAYETTVKRQRDESADRLDALKRIDRECDKNGAPARVMIWERVEAIAAERDKALAALVTMTAEHDHDHEAAGGLNETECRLLAENERLRDALNRDRTGLAAALAEVRNVAEGYRWIADGEWGSYSWEEHTTETLRRETGWALGSIRDIARKALEASGTLATNAIRGDAPKGAER